MTKLIIDGNNLLHRVYHISKNQKTFNENFHIYLFLNSIKAYSNLYYPDEILCVWDEKLEYKANKRKAILEDYKATRDHDRNKEVYSRVGAIKDILQSMGIPSFHPCEYEADDVIGIICDLFKQDEKVIVTVDRDLCQLIDEHTVVYDGIRKAEINLNNFEERLQFSKKEFVVAKSLMGDKSDNVAGVKGFGVKTTKKFFAGKTKPLTKEQVEIFKRNFSLLTINPHNEDRDYVKAQITGRNTDPDWKIFLEVCDDLGFNKILQNKTVWYSTFFQNNRLLKLLS